MTPDGKPKADKETDWLAPETKLTATELFTAEPLATVLLPPLVKLKSKAAGILTEQLAVLVVGPDVTLTVAFLVPADEYV